MHLQSLMGLTDSALSVCKLTSPETVVSNTDVGLAWHLKGCSGSASLRMVSDRHCFCSCDFRVADLVRASKIAILPRQHDKLWMSLRYGSPCCDVLAADGVMRGFEIAWGARLALLSPSVQCCIKITRLSRMALLSYGTH